ncbi:MAG: hypothetical protein AB7I38_17585 [Dehalococcoidia bacterium]
MTGETPLHAIVTTRRRDRCEHCRGKMVRLQGEVHEGDGVAAVYYAALYKHDGVRDVFLDVIAGDWTSSDYSDHYTFTTRTGPVEPDGHIASTMVDGGASYPDDPLFGRKLSRDEALARPDVARLWDLNDAILSSVEEIDRHLY